MHIVADPNNDRRRYNQPAAHVNEVAVVFVGEDGLPPGNLDLVIYDSNPADPNHRMQSISAGSPHADPMLYPLLFPHGETGWHYNLQQEGVRRNAVRFRNSPKEFASFRLAIRYTGTNSNVNEGHTFSLLHAAGFLFQQYICDQYVRMEANNLRYIRDNQKALFADAYQGLLDHTNQQFHLDEINPVGRRTILPSTFLGGPRWPEIVDNIPCWLKATDRPDLVARMFGYVYTIEFQKRGLSHAHILIILDEDSKLLTADDVDSVVCAYLPDPTSERHDLTV
ncbi:uncharacterized protein LOC103309719 [Acyrthosiphon pisum]|uniref:Helitron helicase-like domain-containing protein n=1 Tax=Acyrthosiphon pisum TaxID=7029 RepID=A0A8R2F8Z2_ACYPI|nr:uncharacterized protein LOC103309719 [Acyrthosiphon pisum]|eukprot:XP_008184153.1 PREDICTED: uncharacterized protein LOC103309719 [Acyrthosiphon pisum]